EAELSTTSAKARSVFQELPMKSAIRTLVILCTIALAGEISAAPFQNLGIEDVRTPALTPLSGGIYPGAATGSLADVLPGWQLSLGGLSVTTAGINTQNPFDSSSRATLI